MYGLSRPQVISLFGNRDRQSTLAISKCLRRLKFSDDIFFLDFKFSSTEFSVFQFLENKKLEIGEQLKGKWRGPLLVRAALNLIYRVFSFLVFQFFQFYLNDK